MTNITNEQLEAWAELGPWKSQGQEPDGVYIIGLRTDKHGVPYDNPTNGLVGAALPFPTELDNGDFTRVLTNAALIAAAPALAAALLAERKAREVEVEVGEAKTEITRLRQCLADIANGTNSWFNQAEEALLNARSRIRNEARQALKGPTP